jgi:hypothetical protein
MHHFLDHFGPCVFAVFLVLLAACSSSTNASSSLGNPNAGGTSSTQTDTTATPGSSSGGSGGGVVDTQGTSSTQAGTSGAAGSNSDSNADPLFEKYTLPYMSHTNATYSTNGVVTSVTFYFYVENNGGAGSATLTSSYQGYSETKQFTVESGVQYTLSSFFPMTNSGASVSTCTLSIELPGLTITQNLGGTNALASDFGKCAKVGGQSTSDLIPLSSCTCSGGCSTTLPDGICWNNCGFPDQSQTCCGGCLAAGKSCTNGVCK